jgi:hypothetical protein
MVMRTSERRSDAAVLIADYTAAPAAQEGEHLAAELLRLLPHRAVAGTVDDYQPGIGHGRRDLPADAQVADTIVLSPHHERWCADRRQLVAPVLAQ